MKKKIGTMVRVNEPGNEIDGRTGRLEYSEGENGYVLYAGKMYRVKMKGLTTKEVIQTHRPDPAYAESQYNGASANYMDQMDYEDDEVKEKIGINLNFERWMKR